MHYRTDTHRAHTYRLRLPTIAAMIGLLLGLGLGGIRCDPDTEPEDPRITALWEDPSVCGATPYEWLKDPSIGQVIDWEENELFDYNVAMLESVLSASGFRIEKEFRHDVRVFRFRYVTQDRGELVEATSTIAVPVPADGEPTRYPLLAYLHGTAGFSDVCAPSANLLDPLLAAAFASIGHIVVGPDYLGMVSMGALSANVHPYLLSEPTALASLDAVRAGRKLLEELGVTVTAEPGLSVIGGSQGGHGALALAWYAPYYAPEIHVSGVAASVPPSDLLNQTVMGSSEFISATNNIMAFLGTMADWYRADLSEALLPPYDTRVEDRLATECSLGGFSGDATDVTQIFTPAFRDLVDRGFPDDGSFWSCAMRANSFPQMLVEPLALPPTMFVLSENDELVDTPIERDAFDALCGRGFAMEYLECAGMDHAGGAVGSFAEQLDFLAARRRGDEWPADAQCVRTPPTVCSGTDVQ
jgi:pimeloyl-ACP methyl ester carboxylesterase